METVEESKRIERNRDGNRPANLWASLEIDLGKRPDLTYERIFEVVQLISKYGTYWGSKSTSRWPTDEEWKTLLPAWLDGAFCDLSTYSRTELDRMRVTKQLDEDPRWDFGSWLDSLKERTWEWWSSHRSDSHLIIHLLLEGWPYSTGALEYVITVTGGQIVSKVDFMSHADQ